MTASEPAEAAAQLNDILRRSGLEVLRPEQAEKFAIYLSLILRWNARTNLTAVRDEEGIMSRHFIESIGVAASLPSGIDTLLDFGSGAGFPGIPIAICRPEIAVTLAESQGKKAAFLREAVRVLSLTSQVHSGRAEELPNQFDCVALRAVDKMVEAVGLAARLVSVDGWLAVMTTAFDLEKIKAAAGDPFTWSAPGHLPGSDQRILAWGRRA